jgi:hypothetical protein
MASFTWLTNSIDAKTLKNLNKICEVSEKKWLRISHIEWEIT